MISLKRLGQITEVEGGRTQSGVHLSSAIEARVNQYRNEGVSPGDRILLSNGNNIQFFIEILALLSLGACAVPVDGKSPQAKPVTIKNLAAGHLILYTSGTTGTPKEVCLSIANLEKKFATLEKMIPADEAARTLCILPTHFGHGLVANCLFPLLTGKHLFIAPAFNPKILFSLSEIVDQYQITFLSSVPSIWRILERRTGPRLKTLKRIHCASAPFTNGLFEQLTLWAPGARIFNVFGTTELGSWVSGHEIKSPEEEGYVGCGWDAEIKLSPTEAHGYGNVAVRLAEEEIWHETGDIGSWDNQLGLRLVGRSDDIINNGGLKIHPNEVESILNLHPQVAVCCVFSLPHALTHECVAAAVVLKENSNCSAPDLEAWSREKLAGYRVPAKWFFLKELSTDQRGKISRKKIRNHCVNLKEPT